MHTLLLLLLGCPSSKTEDPDAFSACDSDDGHGFEITDADTGGAPVFVDGDTLWVDVAYGGGCEEHTFTICWPDQSFMESDPVQVNLEIFHGGPADMCEAYLYETLEFDLTPLKDAWKAAYGDTAGTVVINLEGAPDSVEYSFE